MSKQVFVAGVGMIAYVKPGHGETCDVMAEKAVRRALEDAGLAYGQIQQAFAS